MSEEKKVYGVIAEFKTVSGVMKAAEKVRDLGYRKWDVLTPFPIHGLDAAMGLKRSNIPYFTFFGGISGTSLALLIIWYMNAYDYPLVVGGKPFFSPIFPFPVIYELTILLAAFGTFFGMFIMNRLPRYNHPIFNHKGFARATDDHFWIVLESKDPLFHEEKTQTYMKEIGGVNITVLEH